jgi:hypothetical protein
MALVDHLTAQVSHQLLQQDFVQQEQRQLYLVVAHGIGRVQDQVEELQHHVLQVFNQQLLHIPLLKSQHTTLRPTVGLLLTTMSILSQVIFRCTQEGELQLRISVVRMHLVRLLPVAEQEVTLLQLGHFLEHILLVHLLLQPQLTVLVDHLTVLQCHQLLQQDSVQQEQQELFQEQGHGIGRVEDQMEGQQQVVVQHFHLLLQLQ